MSDFLSLPNLEVTRLDVEHIEKFADLCQKVEFLKKILSPDTRVSIVGFVGRSKILKLKLFPYIEDFYSDIIMYTITKLFDEDFQLC